MISKPTRTRYAGTSNSNSSIRPNLKNSTISFTSKNIADRPFDLARIYCLNVQRMCQGVKILVMKEHVDALWEILAKLGHSHKDTLKNCVRELIKLS